MSLFPSLVPIAVLAAVLGSPPPARSAPITIVVLGSSTAAGTGAKPRSMAWAYRYEAYLKSLDPQNRVAHLAVGGYTTYQVLPTGSTVPPGRPQPDPKHNITAGLAEHPDAIILSLTTNDQASGYSMEETKRNFQTIADAAASAGVPFWITTTGPRRVTPDKRQLLMACRDWIRATFKDRVIDVWTLLAKPDGTPIERLNSGDGIHPNNLGHAILYDRVVNARIPQALKNGG